MKINKRHQLVTFIALGLSFGCESESKDPTNTDGEPVTTATNPEPMPEGEQPPGNGTGTQDPAPPMPPGEETTDGPAMPPPAGTMTAAPTQTSPTEPSTEPSVDPSPTSEPTTPEPTTPPVVTDSPDSGVAPPAADASMPTDPPEEVIACETPEEDTFSFFMISYDAIRRFSGSDQGFGGDLGGITGADDLCKRAAMESSTCAGNKAWRAFLSTTQEDAIDRIGLGPWHDRVGRLFANNVEELLNDRPINADPEIIDDFPNEYGIPNQYPNSDTEAVDNHQTLTGSGADGRLYTQEAGDNAGGGSTQCPDGWTAEKATCWDWTSSEPEGCPRVGHSWPSELSGVNWISVWNESGCAPGVMLVQGPVGDGATVGSYGGYGGFYCFAVTSE
jgi:hypothetical protein